MNGTMKNKIEKKHIIYFYVNVMMIMIQNDYLNLNLNLNFILILILYKLKTCFRHFQLGVKLLSYCCPIMQK